MKTDKTLLYVAVFFSLLVSIACLQPFVFDFSFINLSSFFSPEYEAHKFDFIQNVVLFIPLAFLWGSYFSNFKKTILVCIGLSILFELIQLMIPARISSMFDVFANLIGIILGLICCRYLKKFFLKGIDSGEVEEKSFLTLALQLYLLAFVIYSFYPFDLSFHPVEIYRSFKKGALVLMPFSDVENIFTPMLIAVASYIPIGMLSVCVKGRNFRGAFLFSSFIVVGIECLQVFALNRFTSTTDVICGFLGAFFGYLIVSK